MRAKEFITEEDYRGQHQAPGPDNGAPLHDLTGIYPDDIYGPNGALYYGHYGQNNPMDVASIIKIQRARGKPKKGIQIYRAVPKGVKTINPGDWVTINKDYATEHGAGWLEGKYRVLSKIVNAGDLYTDGNSIHEFGYYPANKPQEVVNELFDPAKLKGFPLEYSVLDSGVYDARATDDDGRPIDITIFVHDTMEPTVAKISFKRQGDYELTGQGQEFRVFATVLSAIKDFLSISSVRPQVFFMSAYPEKRLRAYQSIASRAAPSFGYTIGNYNMLSDKMQRRYRESSTLVLVDTTQPKERNEI